MTYMGPDAGVVRQWEVRVARWANRGKGRDEILNEMGQANWAYDDALRLLARVGSRERRKWILWIVIGAALTCFGLVITFLSLRSVNGGVIYVPFGGAAAFIYGIVRLVKLRI